MKLQGPDASAFAGPFDFCVGRRRSITGQRRSFAIVLHSRSVRNNNSRDVIAATREPVRKSPLAATSVGLFDVPGRRRRQRIVDRDRLLLRPALARGRENGGGSGGEITAAR